MLLAGSAAGLPLSCGSSVNYLSSSVNYLVTNSKSTILLGMHGKFLISDSEFHEGKGPRRYEAHRLGSLGFFGACPLRQGRSKAKMGVILYARVIPRLPRVLDMVH
eukprot:COSAG02_NODE_6982_length_3249_cov_1.873968_2_plen_106_part_00